MSNSSCYSVPRLREEGSAQIRLLSFPFPDKMRQRATCSTKHPDTGTGRVRPSLTLHIHSHLHGQPILWLASWRAGPQGFLHSQLSAGCRVQNSLLRPQQGAAAWEPCLVSSCIWVQDPQLSPTVDPVSPTLVPCMTGSEHLCSKRNWPAR